MLNLKKQLKRDRFPYSLDSSRPYLLTSGAADAPLCLGGTPVTRTVTTTGAALSAWYPETVKSAKW